MTLAEWKAMQSKPTSKTEFKVRKANEGADTKQWKGTVALEKKKKGDHSDSEEEEYEYEEVGIRGVSYTPRSNVGVSYTPRCNVGVSYTPRCNVGVFYTPRSNVIVLR